MKTKEMPLVSVVIVNHNGKHFVSKAINSVLSLDYPNLEIIVIDNGSSDGSWEFLNKHFNKQRAVKLIKTSENLFYTGGNNLGAIKARGKWLLFLNSDAQLRSDSLKRMMIFVLKNGKRIVQPKILQFNQRNLIDNMGGAVYMVGCRVRHRLGRTKY
jgi:GT2 family glycosyltransferase